MEFGSESHVKENSHVRPLDPLSWRHIQSVMILITRCMTPSFALLLLPPKGRRIPLVNIQPSHLRSQFENIPLFDTPSCYFIPTPLSLRLILLFLVWLLLLTLDLSLPRWKERSRRLIRCRFTMLEHIIGRPSLGWKRTQVWTNDNFSSLLSIKKNFILFDFAPRFRLLWVWFCGPCLRCALYYIGHARINFLAMATRSWRFKRSSDIQEV